MSPESYRISIKAIEELLRATEGLLRLSKV